MRRGKIHQHLRRRTVGQLAGVARGDVAAFLDDRAVLEDGFQLGKLLEAGVAANALVACESDALLASFAAVLLEQCLFNRDRHDFVVEFARRLRRAGALLAQRRKPVLLLAADAVALRNDLGGLDHRHIGCGIGRLDELGPITELRGMFVDGKRDALHAARHRDVDLVAHDAARRERHGVESRRAFAVERESADRVGQNRTMDGQAAEIVALRVPVIADAEIDVVDASRIDPCPFDRRIDDMRREDRRLGVVEGAAIGLADPGARGGDDGGFTHADILLIGNHVGRTPEGAHFRDLPVPIEFEGVDHVDPHLLAAELEVDRERKDRIIPHDANGPIQRQLRTRLHRLGVEGPDGLASLVDGASDRVFDRRIHGIEFGYVVGAARLEGGDIGMHGGFHLGRLGHRFGSGRGRGKRSEGGEARQDLHYEAPGK